MCGISTAVRFAAGRGHTWGNSVFAVYVFGNLHTKENYREWSKRHGNRMYHGA